MNLHAAVGRREGKRVGGGTLDERAAVEVDDEVWAFAADSYRADEFGEAIEQHVSAVVEVVGWAPLGEGEAEPAIVFGHLLGEVVDFCGPGGNGCVCGEADGSQAAGAVVEAVHQGAGGGEERATQAYVFRPGSELLPGVPEVIEERAEPLAGAGRGEGFELAQGACGRLPAAARSQADVGLDAEECLAGAAESLPLHVAVERPGHRDITSGWAIHRLGGGGGSGGLRLWRAGDGSLGAGQQGDGEVGEFGAPAGQQVVGAALLTQLLSQ